MSILTEIAAIRRLEKHIQEQAWQTAVNNGTLWEVGSIAVELVLTLGPYWPAAEEYLSALARDCRKPDPVSAYLTGKQDALDNQPFLDGLRAYLIRQAGSARVRDTEAALDACTSLLYGILGSERAKDLLTDLSSAYREIHGTIDEKIPWFYQIGYMTCL